MANVESYRDVTAAQATRLWQQEIGVAADGVFGPNTEAATKRYQQEHGVTADGIVGPQTWAIVLGVPDFDYPPTLKRSGSTATAAPAPVAATARVATSQPSTPRPVAQTSTVQQQPLQAGMSMFSGKVPLLAGLALIGAAFYAQIVKNRI